MDITTKPVEFEGALGYKISARMEMPACEPLAYALFAPCFTCGKDIVAAKRIGQRLAARGIACMRIDFSGIGQSGGEFHESSFSSNVEDIILAAKYLQSTCRTPEILIGHSLGGTAVLAAAGQIPESRCVVTIGSPFDPAHVIQHFKDEIPRIKAEKIAEINIMERAFKVSYDFIEDIQAQNLARDGVKELMLIAQDLTYYGLDLYKERKLADLLLALVAVEGIEWIRLHYAFPTGFPEDVLKVMREQPKVCNYLDIPLQHIADPILKSMRRGTTKEKTTILLKKFRKEVPGIILRTSLIVGYPGETEEDFETLKEWVKEMRFERLGCFTYSHEENTHAHQLEDNVPEEIKQERSNAIMEIQSQISWEHNQSCVGKTYRCLIDRKEGVHYVGRTFMDSPDVDNEVLVDATAHYVKQGEFVNLLITEATDYDLVGVPI